MSERNNHDILLESGTNEMEILVFTVGQSSFGINVAKVREIMMPSPVTPMPHAHKSVEGIFKPRDLVLTVMNLPAFLGVEPGDLEKTLFIITNFNKLHIAFRVHGVVGIQRISWDSIEKPDKTVYGGIDGVATGITQIDGKLITILDFEKIVSDIAPSTGLLVSEVTKMGNRKVDSSHIVVVEDSILLSKMLVECLHTAGFTNITKFDNGADAWEYLSQFHGEPNIREKISVLITDIEMPRMDGHRLTKLVKSDPHLKAIPVIIFSSLINDEMRRKGKELGADEQLTKPDIAHLVGIIDHFVEK